MVYSLSTVLIHRLTSTIKVFYGNTSSFGLCNLAVAAILEAYFSVWNSYPLTFGNKAFSYMASFTHFYFYSLGKVTPGLTQRISLVRVSADNTRTAQQRKMWHCIQTMCWRKGQKKLHRPNVHLFSTKLKWIYYASGLHPIGQEAVNYWHFLFSSCSELSVNIFVKGL